MLWSMICSTLSNFTVIAILQDEETEAQTNNVSQAQIWGKAESQGWNPEQVDCNAQAFSTTHHTAFREEMEGRPPTAD